MAGGNYIQIESMSNTSPNSDDNLIDSAKGTALLLGPIIVLKTIIQYKELLRNFIFRDVKLQYRDSIFGWAWSIAEPLMLSVVYYFFFTILRDVPDRAYTFWVIVGVIVWSLFTKCFVACVESIKKNKSMIQQVFFPREIFPLSIVGSQLIISLFSMIIAVPFMVYFDQPLNINILWVPVGIALTVTLALGLGMLLAPLNVVHNDVFHVTRVATRAGFFVTPVLWTIEMAGPRGNYLDYLLLNPMAVPITMVRNGFRGVPIGIESHFVWYSVIFCILAFCFGTMIFKKFESKVVKYL